MILEPTNNVAIPVHVDRNHSKDHPLAIEWEKVCHTRHPFMWVTHDQYRHPSRWTLEKRARPWRVVSRSRNGQWHDVAWCKTLEAAVRKAQEWAVL